MAHVNAALYLNMSTQEIVSAVAAAVSAIGGAFAAVAAFRSADFARKAQLSADESERRSVLRQVILAAKEVQLDAKRCVDATSLLARSYKDLAIFTDNLGGSRYQLMKDAIEEKTKRAEYIENEGSLFSAWPSTLESAPLEEVDRVLTKVLSLSSEARAMYSDLVRERDDVERQCDAYRKSVIEGNPRQ